MGADEELNDLMGKIRLIQMSYQVEAPRMSPMRIVMVLTRNSGCLFSDNG